MKNFLVLLILCFFTSITIAESLSPNEAHILKQINCQPAGFKYEKNRIIFANPVLSSKDKKHFYLIKNISPKNIYIDFPEGHVGASAGLAQAVDQNQWIAYAYIPATDKIHTEDKQGKIVYVQPHWTCTTTDNHTSQCENYLYVCEIKNLNNPASNSLLHKKELARWSEPKVSIHNILNNWSN